MSIYLQLGDRVPQVNNPKDKYKLTVTVYMDDSGFYIDSSNFIFDIKDTDVLRDLLDAFMAFKKQEPSDLDLNNDDHYEAQYNFLASYRDDKDWIDKLEYYRMSNLYVQSLSVTYYDKEGVEFFVTPEVI